MQMRAGRAACGPCITESIPTLHASTVLDRQARHVQVHGLEALAVVDADGVAEHVELLRESYSPRGDRANRFAFGSTLVHAAVRFASRFPVVQTLHTERRGHAP